MKRNLLLSLTVLLVLAGVTVAISPSSLATTGRASYEVWVVDQSDTTPDGGGTLYIFDSTQLNRRAVASASPEVIDLGEEARDLCLAQTGTAPQRPHMLMFDHHHTHAILTFVATGHVLFIDAHTRAAVDCIDVGSQAHAATPSPDGTYVVVANQNGKLLQRINTDFATNTFVLDAAATIDLTTCTTPSGAACQDPALRPDNAPICPIIDSNSRYSFVTLRGGGMFVVDGRATPMAIVAEYDRETIHPNGCGGVETNGTMYINAGGGTLANPLESDLYAFNLRRFRATQRRPNTPAPLQVFSHDERGFVDSHGAVLVNPGYDRTSTDKAEQLNSQARRGAHLWVADRAANRVVVVDTGSNNVVDEFSLAGTLSSDPAPDLMDVAPAGNRVFVTLRGPNPLSANVPDVNNAVGNTPGLGIIRVERGGERGVLQAIIPISHVVNGVEQADPHGLAVRRVSH